MTPPALTALRLVTALAGARAPRPPLGLAAYSDDPDAAIAVLLDVDTALPERAQVDAAAPQLPAADGLPPGRVVLVLAERASRAGLLGRLLLGPRPVARAVRATALAARGYVEIGAGRDAKGRELVWGKAAGDGPP